MDEVIIKIQNFTNCVNAFELRSLSLIRKSVECAQKKLRHSLILLLQEIIF